MENKMRTIYIILYKAKQAISTEKILNYWKNSKDGVVGKQRHKENIDLLSCFSLSSLPAWFEMQYKIRLNNTRVKKWCFCAKRNQ